MNLQRMKEPANTMSSTIPQRYRLYKKPFRQGYGEHEVDSRFLSLLVGLSLQRLSSYAALPETMAKHHRTDTTYAVLVEDREKLILLH